jgi:hypothetical protein
MRLAPYFAAATFSALALCAGSAGAADWILAPSTYTHDPMTAERVAQYSPIGPFYYFARPDYLKSGYRNYRSTIDLGNSSDNLIITEQWGAPVRPFEEWRFPYRPYSVPYDLWGPPFGGLGNYGQFYGGFPGPYPYGGGFGAGPAGAAGVGPGGGPGGGGVGPGGGGFFPGHHYPPAVNYAQPWADGHYPEYDLNDRSEYWRPYVAPKVGP